MISYIYYGMHLVVITVVNKDEIIKKNSHVVSSANSTELARLILHLGNDNVYLLCFFYLTMGYNACMYERERDRQNNREVDSTIYRVSFINIFVYKVFFIL
jgi:hypothetical protein